MGFLLSTVLALTAIFHSKDSGGAFASRLKPMHSGGGGWNPQAIFIPRRTKFKGYMRENRRSTFNSTK
jgi:hypothetical protein